MWSKGMFAYVVLVVIAAPALAETGKAAESASSVTDQQAYCQYLTEQATARRDLLLTPSAVTGVTQPNTGLPMQLVWGLSSSLSDALKAGLTMDAARKNCELYAATTAAEQGIQYALPSLEKKVLQHRLELIQQASEKLDAIIAATARMVEAQNVSRPMFFSLQTTRIKLDADYADTQSKIATLYTPSLVDRPLKQLVAEKQSSEVNEQKAVDKLSRQNNWDVSLAIGAHQQITPLVDNSSPYGAVTVSYNLASHAINKHLDQAADAYAAWKKVQEGDVTRNAAVLKEQVAAGISAQANRLKALQRQQEQVESNLHLLADSDTTAAMDFRNQLTSTQLLLGIEIGDADFRLERLQDFLENNY